MKPALIKRWIENLFPAEDNSTTITTTEATLAATDSSVAKTYHSSSISSFRLPPPYVSRHRGEFSISSSISRRNPEIVLDGVQHHSDLPNGYKRAYARPDNARDPKDTTQGCQIEDPPILHHESILESAQFDSLNEAESTRWTVDDAAVPAQLNLRLHNYESCNLLWLRPNLNGKKAVGATHPFHHTHYDAAGATMRSLVVFIAAVCLDEAHQYFKPAGIGVFFNKHSSSNVSDSFDMTYQLESSRSGTHGLVPHLAAARSALQTVRTVIVPDRIQTLRIAALRYGWSEVDVQAVARFQLIVATDSEVLLREISSCKSSNQLRRSLDVGESGERDILVDLLDQIETLSKLGIQVMWSRVSERWNRPARKLAADAVIGSCVRLKGRKPSRITGVY